jgi:hypothetical protein
MSPQAKELLLATPIALAVVIGVAFLWRLTERFGLSHWLGGVVILTVSLLALLLMTYRTLDPGRKKASALMALGLVALSIASVVNEYVSRFFTPSGLYVLAAFLPTTAFLGYRSVRDILESRETAVKSVVPNAAGGSNSLWRLMLLSRAAWVVFLLSFLIVGQLNTSKMIRGSLIAAICFSIFTDALISYVDPTAAKRRPTRPFEAVISRLSLFADPKATPRYALGVVILSAFMCLTALYIAYR